MTDGELRTLLAALRRRDPDGEVQLVETHISWVLLVGDRVLKIKKPIDLGFLDFTTLARRRHFCEEELRLNRRLAPDLYLDVVTIAGTPDDPDFGGAELFEYAVRMKRFDQASLLAHVLERGELATAHVDEFASVMAEFHTHVERVDEGTPYGSLDAIRQPMEDGFATLREGVRDSTHARRLNDLREWSDTEFERRRSVFCQRRRDGFVRECHGDAHLGNAIVDDSGECPTVLLFDGIEFAPELRWIDVASDAAFAVMDLADRGRPDLSHRFLNAYLERTGDYAGLAVMPYYLVYRSLVRAKVAAIRRGQPGVTPEERSRLATELEGYLDLAERYANRPAATLVITVAVSGSGKSTVAQRIVDEGGAIRIRSDVERKRLADVGSGRGDLYSEETTRRTYDRLLNLTRGGLSSGFNVVVDATFLDRSRRAPFRHLAAELGVPFVIAHVVADPEVLRARIVERSRKGIDASDADLSVLERQLRDTVVVGDDEADRVVIVDTADPEREATAIAMLIGDSP